MRGIDRLATRIAWRQARRRPGRTLLVMALVAVPVAGMTMATTLFATDARTPERLFDDEVSSYYDVSIGLGQPDWTPGDPAAVDTTTAPVGGPPALTVADIEAALLDGSTMTVIRSGQVRARTETARAIPTVTTMEPDEARRDARDPLVDGAYPGAQPTGAPAGAVAPIAISTALADQFDLGAGDTLRLLRPDLDVPVSGVFETRSCLDCQTIMVADVRHPLAAQVDDAQTEVLIRLPDSVRDGSGPITAVTDTDGTLLSGDSLSTNAILIRPSLFVRLPAPILALVTERYDVTSAAGVGWSIVIGAVVLAVVGIIIASAFAVSARSQLALLGQLSANGATESVLRRVLTRQGTVTGVAGAALGISIGVVGLVAGENRVEALLDRRIDGYPWSPAVLVVIAVVGTLGASIAARVPARTAARIPTLAALAGRRPQAAVPGSLAWRGIAAFIGGTLVLTVIARGQAMGEGADTPITLTAIAASLAVLFGATATTPALVALLEPLAGRTRGAARVAIRSLTRHRGRSGAIVAAVAAAGALAIGGSTASLTLDPPENYDEIGFADITPGVVRLATRIDVDRSVSDLTTGESTQSYRTSLQPPSPAVTAAMTAVLPGATVRVVDGIELAGPDDSVGVPLALVVDTDLARELRFDDAIIDELATSGIVVVLPIDEGFADRARVALPGQEPVDVPSRFSRFSLSEDRVALITPDHGAMLALTPVPTMTLLTDPDGILDDFDIFDLDRARLAVDTAIDEPAVTTEADGQAVTESRYSHTDVAYTLGDGTNTPEPRAPIEAILTTVAIGLALFVVAIGLALTAADARDERTTLAVVGMRPATLATSTANRAWLLATLGFALAVPLGYIPAAAILNAGRSREMSFPLTVVVVLVVAAPAVAWLATRLVSAVAARVRPLQLSTAIFE